MGVTETAIIYAIVGLTDAGAMWLSDPCSGWLGPV